MHDRPTAAELLAEIAGLLEDDVLQQVHGPTQHNVRVAANLARIVERELALGPAADERERAALRDVLGHDGEAVDLNAELARRLRDKEPGLAAAAWPALVGIARDKVAIVKPGHDSYEFDAE